MIDMIVSSISSISCFIFPLLLTLKSLNRIHQDRVKDLSILTNNLQFLVNYWICYVAVMYFQNNIACKLAAIFGLGGVIDLCFLVLKLWLFYGHGCLIMNYFYIRRLSERVFGTQSNDFIHFEKNLFEPFIRRAVVNNYCVNAVMALFQKLVGDKNVFTDCMSRITLFIDSMPRDETFLQFSLLYICYIDSSEDLVRSYRNSERLLEDIVSFNWLKNASVKRNRSTDYKSFKILNYDDLSKIARSENKRDGYGSIYPRSEKPYVMDTVNRGRAVSLNGSNTYTIAPGFFPQNKRKVPGATEQVRDPLVNPKKSDYASPTRLRSNSGPTRYELSSQPSPPYPTDPSIESMVKRTSSPTNSNISNPILDYSANPTARRFRKISKKF